MSALCRKACCKGHNVERIEGKMLRNIYGLDLGTYEIKVYDKKQGTIWKEKNVVAVMDNKEIISVGDEAYEMFERSPGNIQVVFPMKEGVISHFHDMQYLLQNILKKERRFARGSEYVIAVPTDVTEVEKHAFYDLVIHSTAKAKSVSIVERALAQTVGLDLDVRNTKGLMIVDLGAETTEISVISTGGLVLNKMLKTGGVTFDNAICNLIRRNYDFLIGQRTAEMLRRRFGVFGGDGNSTMKVSGRNLVTGVPNQMDISIGVVRAAMREPLSECIANITSMLDRTPPEVLKFIQQNGIYLVGGLAYLPGLSRYVEEATGYSVHTTRRPDLCTVDGLKKIINSKELKGLTYSMLDSRYRWLK